MGLFPQTMLKATIIVPIEDFPRLIIQLAETEKFMPKDTTIDEELEDYFPTTKLDSIRRIESSFEDLLKTLPEPKEKLSQKIARAYRKIPPLEPLFTNWENIEEIRQQWKVDRTFEPDPEPGNFDEIIKGWNKALERSRVV